MEQEVSQFIPIFSWTSTLSCWSWRKTVERVFDTVVDNVINMSANAFMCLVVRAGVQVRVSILLCGTTPWDYGYSFVEEFHGYIFLDESNLVEPSKWSWCFQTPRSRLFCFFLVFVNLCVLVFCSENSCVVLCSCSCMDQIYYFHLPYRFYNSCILFHDTVNTLLFHCSLWKLF